MPLLSSPGHACLVLPQALPRYAADAGLRALLARGELVAPARPASQLVRVLESFRLDGAVAAQAALRLWGETGERPAGWVGAADPVWLQAGLDRLYLHAPPPGDVDADEFAGMLADLESALLDERHQRLLAHGERGYLLSADALPTADAPPAALDGERPDAYLPAGRGAVALQSLASEIQMSLHQHPANAERERAGRRPVNALWFWGGGEAPAPASRALPTLHADDPLLVGYWLAAGRAVAPDPARLADCLDGGDLVARAADLDEFAGLWRAGRLRRATLLFADGYRVCLRRGLRALLRRRPAELGRLAGDAG